MLFDFFVRILVIGIRKSFFEHFKDFEYLFIRTIRQFLLKVRFIDFNDCVIWLICKILCIEEIQLSESWEWFRFIMSVNPDGFWWGPFGFFIWEFLKSQVVWDFKCWSLMEKLVIFPGNDKKIILRGVIIKRREVDRNQISYKEYYDSSFDS